MSVTLAQARREIAARAAEFLQGTATGGSTTTLIDTNNLVHADGYWEEAVVLFTSGTNNEAQQRVQTFTASTKTATFYGTATRVRDERRRLRAVPTVHAERHQDGDQPRDQRRRAGLPREAPRCAHRDDEHAQYDFPTMMMDKGLVGIEYQWYVDSTQLDWPYQKVSPDLYEIIERGTSPPRA
jgi:hypothetical protein